MGHLFDKLNLKEPSAVLILAAPLSFEPQLSWLRGRRVLRDLSEASSVEFALAFCTMRRELDALSHALIERASDDAVLWFAYPKKTSKRYRADFDRDHGWGVLQAAGYRPVRQVAIDEDWSALRYRQLRR